MLFRSPLTLLEAVAHEAPVIVSDIPPHLEIVGADGAGHHVVRQGDADALAAAMISVLRGHPRERSGARELSGQVASRYSWDAITTATELVYERALGRTLVQTAPAIPDPISR